MRQISFTFQKFAVADERCGLRLGTDGVLLGAWAHLPYPHARTAVDVGAGCGIVALMLAQRFPDLRIEGIEIDPGAATDCAENFASSPWADRLMARCRPFSDSLTERVDMIVSNPPFFTTGELSPLATRAASRHAGDLSPYTLIDAGGRLLNPGGTLTMITPADTERDLIAHAAFARMNLRRFCLVSSVAAKPPVRILWEFSPADGPVEYTALTLRTPSGQLTPEFAALTADFYLKK